MAVALLAVTLFFLLWGGLYWSFPALLAPKERAGFVGSVMNFAGSTGGIAVPLLAGFILQETGTYTLVLYYFAGCAVLYVAGSLMIEFEAKQR
jgi:ACS family D-galactonate transporter-like MFS transporter